MFRTRSRKLALKVRILIFVIVSFAFVLTANIGKVNERQTFQNRGEYKFDFHSIF